jgi:RimJ/RimL family protein N-acetyltransferase
MEWCSPAYSVKDSTEFVVTRPAEWDEDEHYSFVIEETATGRFLGGAGLNFINRIHNFANLGYWVRTSATGHGIASAAVRLVARFGFLEQGFSRLEILAALGNVASQRVADRAGARREGVLRKRLHIHGQVLDAVLFSLVAEDVASPAAVPTAR